MLEVKDLREKNIEELKELIEKTKKELMTTKFQIAAGGVKDHSVVSKKRRDVARILTIINEKNREEKS